MPDCLLSRGCQYWHQYLDPSIHSWLKKIVIFQLYLKKMKVLFQFFIPPCVHIMVPLPWCLKVRAHFLALDLPLGHVTWFGQWYGGGIKHVTIPSLGFKSFLCFHFLFCASAITMKRASPQSQGQWYLHPGPQNGHR